MHFDPSILDLRTVAISIETYRSKRERERQTGKQTPPFGRNRCRVLLVNISIEDLCVFTTSSVLSLIGFGFVTAYAHIWKEVLALTKHSGM